MVFPFHNLVRGKEEIPDQLLIDPGFPYISEITGTASVHEVIPTVFRQVF
jgi:hypothetical protein